MAASLSLFTALQHCFRTAALALLDLGRLVALIARPRSALSAEDLCLRKQLALFQNERHLKLILRPWVAHFNHGRPHMSLGGGDAGAIACRAAEKDPAHKGSTGART